MAARYTDSLDAMVGVSQRIAERMRAMPEFAGIRVEAIPYGIAFGPEQPRAPLAAGEPLRVLYLGRLIEEQKRISRVIELVKRCEAAGAPVRFTIAGSGPEEAQVRAALAGSAIAHVRGAVPNTQVPALLRAHDIYLLLSDFEGLPLSLLEAMGEGVVPVVSDLESGMSEVVTTEVGLRVPVGDVSAAQEALTRLNEDRARLAALSQGATRQARAHFSAERMVSQYLALIDEIAPALNADWPKQIEIPAPRGVPAWMFSGWRRNVRRALKRLRG
jgi:glycosyltransferase involved in cell wall biosynthesis